MSQETAGAESTPGTEANPASTEVPNDGGTQADPFAAKFEDQQAAIDMLGDQFQEFKDTVVGALNNLRQPQPQQEDDDEPGELTERKVERIVQGALQQHGAAIANNSQKQSWDEKAKSKFPFTDPKFQRELRRTWNEQVVNGPINGQHAKALYNVAEITAARIGASKPKAREEVETTSTSDTGLPPSGATRTATSTNDDDALFKSGPAAAQLQFYTMKGDRTKEQIDAFKAKIIAKHKRKEGRR